jgi:hypothetical protein
MAYKFEARPYGPDSTPEEIEAIKARIYVYEPGILYWRELPVQSVFHLDIVEQRLNQEAAAWPHYDMLIDLVEATAPSAEVRQRLRRLIIGQSKLRRHAVFTGKNFLLNIAGKFIFGGSMAVGAVGVYKTLEEAHQALHQGRK